MRVRVQRVLNDAGILKVGISGNLPVGEQPTFKNGAENGVSNTKAIHRVVAAACRTNAMIT